MLDRPFDADRATLITETVLSVVREFHVGLRQLHNDSTTVTLTGKDYPGGGEERGGKPVVKPAFGHNKDFRPDLVQLLFVLTVSADGAVPIAYRVLDGNTSDDTTHIPTWDKLVTLVGDPGFLYVADSKLCSKEAMGHIASNKGRFVTVIPHGRKEDTWFRDWAQSHAPAWSEAARQPGTRIGDPDEVWRTFEAPVPSSDGYRVVWVHSSAKAARDAASRAARIEAGLAAVEQVQARLESPKTRLKTKVAAEEAAKAALAAAGASRWVGFSVDESIVTDYRQENRGRPGSTTRYRRTDKAVFSVAAKINAELVSYDAATDGCFPLITNDKERTPAAVLAAYRYQPNLERRNHMLKGPQLVAPHRVGDELGAVVAAQVLGGAAFRGDSIEHGHDVVGVDRAFHLGGERLTAELVDDVQELEHPPVCGLVELEVTIPHHVRGDRTERACDHADAPKWSLLLPIGHLQAFFPPQALDALAVHPPAGLLGRHIGPAPAPAGSPPSEVPQECPQGELLVAQDRCGEALGGAGLADNGAGPALGDPRTAHGGARRPSAGSPGPVEDDAPPERVPGHPHTPHTPTRPTGTAGPPDGSPRCRSEA